MKPIELKGFEGHIVLYCKSHYNVKDVDFLTGLRRIWAIRCGLEERFTLNGEVDRYIANSLFKIFKLLNPSKANDFFETIHSEIDNNFRYKELKPFERLILMYRSELAMIQIREKRNIRYVPIIKLPKPQKQLFKRIISGKGEYNDYKLVA